MSRLRLDLIVRRYGRPGLALPNSEQDKWSWRLWSGSRIVSTSGPQLYSRRIDCARGAEVGAGICGLRQNLESDGAENAYRHGHLPGEYTGIVDVRIIDERMGAAS